MTQTYSDDLIKTTLSQTRTIALVGYSAKPDRASHRVAGFLANAGYRVIPVNPGLAGKTALGEVIVARLADIPKDAQVDMVDIFRASDAAGMIVQEALAHLPDLKTIWMQLGVINEEAAQLAQDAGKTVIMDRCPKIEISRLLS
ncbi:MAG: CoA-binding protein [Maritimibacter sp.]